MAENLKKNKKVLIYKIQILRNFIRKFLLIRKTLPFLFIKSVYSHHQKIPMKTRTMMTMITIMLTMNGIVILRIIWSGALYPPFTPPKEDGSMVQSRGTTRQWANYVLFSTTILTTTFRQMKLMAYT